MPELDNFDDILDDSAEPDEVPASDTSVSQIGDEIHESVKPVEEEVVEEVVEPSKTEELEKPPEEPEEKPPEPSSFEAEFLRLGLNKQFKEGPEEMLRRVPDMNRYITTLESERNRLREQVATREPEPAQAPSADDLYADPAGVISRIVDERMNTVNQKLVKMEVDTFVNSHPDFDDMLPLMGTQLEKNPSLARLEHNAIPVLYQMAKAEQLAGAAKAAKTAPQPTVVNKTSAETSPGKKVIPADEDSMEAYRDMSIEELRRKYKYAPE